MKVEAAEISVRYGRRNAVDRISIDIGPGVTALVGPNGAGKTSLLRVLSGSMRPSTGRVAADGIDPYDSSRRSDFLRSVGWLPQNPPTPSDFSVARFLDHVAWLKCVPGSERAASIDWALGAVNLAAFASRRLSTLSGGERRRATLAGALVNRPSLVLLDEPTAGLDPAQRSSLYAVLNALPEDVSVVASTHLVEDVASGARRVLGMRHGRIVLDVETNDQHSFEDISRLVAPVFEDGEAAPS